MESARRLFSGPGEPYGAAQLLRTCLCE